MNTLAATLARILRRERPPRRRAEALDFLPADAGTDDDPLPRGCGWFVSSLDLREGLAVTEHDVMVVEAVLVSC